MKPRILSSEIAHQNPWYHVRHDKLEWPDGHCGEYFVTEGWSGCAIVAVNEGRLLTVSQYRYTVDKISIEMPMGRINPDETPEQGARREFEEETGCQASNMKLLAKTFVGNGYSHVPLYIFLATGFTLCQQQLDHEEQGMTAYWMPLEEWRQKIRSGEITDNETLGAWAVYQAQER
ncbi:MAG: NUDIX domain-containing protein [Patescibacteria group bacterium]